MARVPEARQAPAQRGTTGPTLFSQPRTANAAIANFGGELQREGFEGLDRIKRRRDQTWSLAQVADAQESWSNLFRESQDASEPGAEGFADALRQQVEEDYQQRLANAGSPERRTLLERRLSGLMINAVQQGNAYEAREGARFMTEQTQKSLSAMTAALETQPGLYQTSFETGTQAIQDLDVPPAVRAQLLEDFQGRATISHVRGLIREDYQTARDRLEEGVYDQYIDGDAKSALITRTHTQQAKIEAEQRRIRAERDAAHKARYEHQLAATEVALERGEIGLADLDDAYAEGQGWLEPGDWSRLYRRAYDVDSSAVNKQSAIDLVDGVMRGENHLDFRDKDHRKSVDIFYSEIILPKLAAEQDPVKRIEQQTAFINRVGYIPKSLQGQMRGGLRRSGFDDDKIQISKQVAALHNTNPAMLEDFSAKDISMAMMISEAVETGAKPEVAVQMAEDAMKRDDGVEKIRREAMRAESGKMMQRQRNRIISDLDSRPTVEFGSFLGMPIVPTVNIGGNPDAPDALLADIDTAFERHFLATGNEDVARAQALGDLKRVWGVTTINGIDEYMKWAPEVIHAVRQGAQDPGRQFQGEWMRRQLETDLGAAGETFEGVEVDAGKVRLVPGPFTPSTGMYGVVDRETGAPILAPDPSPGAPNDMAPMTWGPDWGASETFSEMRAAHEKFRKEAAASAPSIDSLREERERRAGKAEDDIEAGLQRPKESHATAAARLQKQLSERVDQKREEATAREATRIAKGKLEARKKELLKERERLDRMVRDRTLPPGTRRGARETRTLLDGQIRDIRDQIKEM